MGEKELEVLGNIWSALWSRRDIDTLVTNLVGSYTLLLSSPIDGCAVNWDLYELVYQIKLILDIQRTHLQSWTPFAESSESHYIQTTQDQAVYLISYHVLLHVVMYLIKLLNSIVDSSTTRRLLVQAISSGVRVLCIHPNAISRSPNTQPTIAHPVEEATTTNNGYDPLIVLLKNLPQNDFSPEEQSMLVYCRASLENDPVREKHMRLPHIERKLYPLDRKHLIETVEQALNCKDEPLRKYCALHDISWSIISAAIQCRADGADLKKQNCYELAQQISARLSQPVKPHQSPFNDHGFAAATNRTLRLLPGMNSESSSQEDGLELQSLERFLAFLTGLHGRPSYALLCPLLYSRGKTVTRCSSSGSERTMIAVPKNKPYDRRKSVSRGSSAPPPISRDPSAPPPISRDPSAPPPISRDLPTSQPNSSEGLPRRASIGSFKHASSFCRSMLRRVRKKWASLVGAGKQGTQ